MRRQTYGYLPSLSWYSFRLPTKGWPGWVDLGGWLVYPLEVTHPGTNRAKRRVTTLIEPNALPLSYRGLLPTVPINQYHVKPVFVIFALSLRMEICYITASVAVIYLCYFYILFRIYCLVLFVNCYISILLQVYAFNAVCMSFDLGPDFRKILGRT